jgi:hypothetical protein
MAIENSNGTPLKRNDEPLRRNGTPLQIGLRGLQNVTNFNSARVKISKPDILPLYPSGAFFGMYVRDGGGWNLVGGQVTGGSGTRTIEDQKIIAPNGQPEKSDGTHMILRISGQGYSADGVLLAGFTLQSASIMYGSSVPSNTLPTYSNLSGTVHESLGVFNDREFIPNRVGNVFVSFCPSSFSVYRS